MVENSRF